MKTKRDINREYKERPKTAGIFQARNSVNEKILLGSSLNLEGPLSALKFMLSINTHRNKTLQQEYNTYGGDNFTFDILERVNITDNPHFNIEDELTLQEDIWLEKLQPFGDRGYNTDNKIRQA